MPSTPYDLVKDDQDLRVPMHAEKAFFHGITFQAKFIGWEEVPRPNTRAEIVQAMRRIRYECKVQNLKKRKVTINVSVDGVRVLLKKRRRKKKQWTNDPEEIELMNHPVYRIFYVSHDSSDLKIFSYIARDASTDTFKCSVFKSNKKSQAMRVVRTVGQAFEVCHKFNLHKNSLDNNDERSDLSSELFDAERIQEQLSDEDILKKDQIAITPEINTPQRPNHLELVPQANNCTIRKSSCSDGEKSPSSPLSSSQEVYKLKEQLEQQSSQTRQALSQLMLVREQLISETNARMEAQARTQQLLQQNRELLEHLASLGAYNEQAQPGLTSANIALAPQSQLQLLLQDQSELNGPLRKTFLTTPCNSNLVSINQQLNNLGSINQQLTSLSHQLSGLNQQSQNLQNYQQQQQQQQQQPQPHPSPKPQHHQIQIQQQTANSNHNNSNNGNQYPTLNQLQNISNQLTGITGSGGGVLSSNVAPIGVGVNSGAAVINSNSQDVLSKELFQMNQELLNRLQNLNLGISVNNNNNNNNGGNNNCNSLTAQNLSNNNNNTNSASNNSYFYVNPMSCSPHPTHNNNNNINNNSNNISNNHNNSNYNFLSSPSSLGNLTPSPMGTLNRNSYSNSPINDDLGLSIDKNLNCLEDGSFIRPLSSLNHISNNNNNNNNNGGCSIGTASGSIGESNRSDSSSSPHKLSDQRLNIPNNTVMLKVTDESGNITNTKKLSATPSFITRSTSEKVPNRSQIMSQVQRTAWARHTTK